MYWARDEGRASRMFDPSMRDRVVSRYEIEHGLQNAMDNGELALFYQPVVDLHSGQVVGAEALLRWQRPEQGLLLPGEFLDVAGEVGHGRGTGPVDPRPGPHRARPVAASRRTCPTTSA